MRDLDPNDDKEAYHLLEALWLHQQHNVRDEDLLNKLLTSKVKHAVVAANTVKHFWHNVDATGARGFVAPAEIEFVKYDPPKHLSPADQKAYALGAEVYQRHSHCATCHLTDGKGNGTVYPPLVDSPWVNGSEERLIKLALHGMWGKITVKGKTYDPARGVPPMTAFRSLLSDEELAAVLTFVRNTWDNHASPIRVETVKRVRAETADRTTFWNPEELLKEHPLEASLSLADIGINPKEFSNKKLEEELLSTSPAELAREAIAKGDAERGKTLFYKSAAACFACHDPPAGAIRLGPDLAKLKTTLNHEELVDSILRPSKRIDKEFAQISVLTVEGKQYTGVRVSEDDKQLVLRNLAQPTPITIKKDDVDEVFDSRTSLMPANLTRLLKSRAEFNDLVKYIIEVRKR